MSHGWNDRDKGIAKAAAERARRRAEKEAIGFHLAYKITGIDDLWALELKIREWRRDLQRSFGFSYETADEHLGKWLVRGWLMESEISNMSPERLQKITAARRLQR